MTILDKLAAYARVRVEQAKQRVPLEEIRELALAATDENKTFAFEEALRKPGLSFICECKKASPSKGLIDPLFPYLQIAREYEAAGADCISVLTEPRWFLGRNEYLKEIAAAVSIPCLRKDFTVDEYMIYEAKLLGASAVLLICSLTPAHSPTPHSPTPHSPTPEVEIARRSPTPEVEIARYISICDSLGMSALVEAHDEAEVEVALRAGARIIGVNNRNLKDFTVDTKNSRRLRECIPKDVLFVSESGVRDAADVERLREIGADAVLVGEALMRAPDKRAALAQLRGEIS